MSAAAVGLVELVWRNFPLEDMHADGGLRGLGPSDGEMFAESVALHRVAKAALPKEFSLLEFEDHVLDRHRPWAAGGRTLQEVGYGSLGTFIKHVRGRTNALLATRDDGYRLLLGYLIMVTRLYGGDHYGMPRWPAIAGSVRELLLTPDHPAWLGDCPRQECDTALAVAPPGTRHGRATTPRRQPAAPQHSHQQQNPGHRPAQRPKCHTPAPRSKPATAVLSVHRQFCR